MKNTIDCDTLNVHSGAFSLDKFIESDAPGTLSWLNTDEIKCSSVVPLFDSTKLNKQVIACQRLCAGCRRWQAESSGIDRPHICNPETK